MKKKTTVLLALISMCLIATAGIGAVSASDESVVSATVGKINPDGIPMPVKTFEGSGPMVVTATMNEDGSMDITKENRRISEDELCGGLGLDNCPNVYTVTPETELPLNIEKNGVIMKANTLKPSERIDAFAGRYSFYAYAENPARWCSISTTNPYGHAGCEAGRSGNNYYCTCSAS